MHRFPKRNEACENLAVPHTPTSLEPMHPSSPVIKLTEAPSAWYGMMQCWSPHNSSFSKCCRVTYHLLLSSIPRVHNTVSKKYPCLNAMLSPTFYWHNSGILDSDHMYSSSRSGATTSSWNERSDPTPPLATPSYVPQVAGSSSRRIHPCHFTKARKQPREFIYRRSTSMPSPKYHFYSILGKAPRPNNPAKHHTSIYILISYACLHYIPYGPNRFHGYQILEQHAPDSALFQTFVKKHWTVRQTVLAFRSLP